MHFFRLFLAALILLIGIFVAKADDCWVCDDEIELTASYANCYTSNYDLLEEAFEKEGIDRKQINLAGCSNEKQVSQRGGLLKIGQFPPPKKSNVKSVYTLSKVAANCLFNLLDSHKDEIDPTVMFNLSEVCENEQ